MSTVTIPGVLTSVPSVIAGILETVLVTIELYTPDGTYATIPLLDHLGNPVLNSNGNPIMTKVLV